MKVAVTADDVKVTRYSTGRWDFYTRLVELDPDLIAKIQKIEELYVVAQRVLAAVYTSQGKFILPEDLKVLECLNLTVTEAPTPEAPSAKPRRKQATGAPSSNE